MANLLAVAQANVRNRWRSNPVAILRGFDPSEPRDEEGKWTDGGGSDGGGDSGGGVAAGDAPEAKLVASQSQAGVAKGAKIAKDNGVKSLTGSVGHPNLISTRLASAKGVDQSIFRQPSVAAMKENQKNFDHDMALFKNAAAYPNLRPAEVAGSSESISRAVIDHSKANLKYLYDNAPTDTKLHGKFWYDGARNIVNEQVDKYKLNDASVSGVYAALSPQKVWDANVYLGDRVIEIHQTQQDTKWSKQMDATAAKIWKTDRTAKLLALVQGKTLGELKSPAEKAIWIRTFDETYSDRNFRAISPLGERGDYVTNKDGSRSRAAWQSTPAVANAIRSLESKGDPAIISASMGTQHKVRSFFNNILDPASKNGDVTIDTHAVGAALLRPLSGADAGVLHSMGLGPDGDKKPPGWEAASGSVKTGVQGVYGVYATAYRELAHELNIQPRQLQSITWEAKRKLFDRSLKDTEAKAVDEAWTSYHTGKASLKETQQKVVEAVGGFGR